MGSGGCDRAFVLMQATVNLTALQDRKRPGKCVGLRQCCPMQLILRVVTDRVRSNLRLPTLLPKLIRPKMRPRKRAIIRPLDVVPFHKLAALKMPVLPQSRSTRVHFSCNRQEAVQPNF